MRWDVHYVEETGSTNDDLLALARAGAPVGTVVRAGHQTAGRGRLGRTWRAPPGTSLLASILLAATPVPFVTVARVALAASDACRELTGVDAALKWPNDLVVGDRKLGGLLAETDGGSPTIVVGIGCNVSWPEPGSGAAGLLPEDVADEVVSLASSAEAVPSPSQLLDRLLAALDGWLARGDNEVLVAHRPRCSTLGRTVRVTLPGNRTLEGRAVGIAPSGELEVAAGGISQLVRAGDVVHVRAT